MTRILLIPDVCALSRRGSSTVRRATRAGLIEHMQGPGKGPAARYTYTESAVLDWIARGTPSGAKFPAASKA